MVYFSIAGHIIIIILYIAGWLSSGKSKLAAIIDKCLNQQCHGGFPFIYVYGDNIARCLSSQ